MGAGAITVIAMKLRGKQAYENKRNEKGETRRKIFSLFFGLILFGDFITVKRSEEKARSFDGLYLGNG